MGRVGSGGGVTSGRIHTCFEVELIVLAEEFDAECEGKTATKGEFVGFGPGSWVSAGAPVPRGARLAVRGRGAVCAQRHIRDAETRVGSSSPRRNPPHVRVGAPR